MDLADLDPDPVAQFRRWSDDVVAAGLPEPTAMILSTAPAAPGAQPLARHVLLKAADVEGFAWVSNRLSRKGRHLAENPRACLVFPWFAIGRQVIVTGAVGIAPDAESDAYFRTRGRGSQLAAWASEQSQPIPDRAWLESRWAELDARFAGADIPRPPHWGMYRLVPDSIEFWLHGDHRMHDRFQFTRPAPTEPWAVTRLAP
ncbi:MAG: pyridoxamine 5'-phosphate oxidase [Acidimicrobiia bacterium]|nr:pyridoxamine 5'-phosphate oxidase [Acidimicrobiia bacterium]